MAALDDSRAIAQKIQVYKARHPVRAEMTNTRDLAFSQYVRTHLRPSVTGCLYNGVELGGFVAFDLDWILDDYEHRLLQLIEVKTRGGIVRPAQKKTLGVVDALLRAGVNTEEGKKLGYTYLGLHTLVLENTTPINSRWRKWDGELISAEECWRRLNMFDALAPKMEPKPEVLLLPAPKEKAA